MENNPEMPVRDWRKDFGFQPGTVADLEISHYFIESHFGRKDCDDLIYAYFAKYRIYLREDRMFHDDPWRWATRIYFVAGLNGDHADLRRWEIDNDLLVTPPGVAEYLRKHNW